MLCPSPTEHKLAQLRRSQGIRHRMGPAKGQPQLPKKSYQRVHVRRGLDELLLTEELPLTTAAPPAERRVLKELGCKIFQPRFRPLSELSTRSSPKRQEVMTLTSS